LSDQVHAQIITTTTQQNGTFPHRLRLYFEIQGLSRTLIRIFKDHSMMVAYAMGQ